MADHAAKAELFDALADAAKALGNGRQAELVDVLSQGERSVEELAAEIDQTVANTSQHLQRLLRSGLVRARRDGTRIYYSLASPTVSQLWRMLRQAAEEHVADLDRLAQAYLGDRSGPGSPGRRLLPARELAERDRLGRGPYCVYADDAVRLLTRNGVGASRLDGYPEWQTAGHPIG